MITAKQATDALKAHGFTVHSWGRTYTIRRDIPPYGSSCDHRNGQRVKRDWASFHASNVSLKWLRKLGLAVVTADSWGTVTPRLAADAWADHKKAQEEWESADWKWNYGEKYCAEQWSQRKRDDLGVAAIRAEGDAKVAARAAEILREAWATEHPA